MPRRAIMLAARWLAGTSASAEDAPWTDSHVGADSCDVSAAITDTSDRSSTVRFLIERHEQSEYPVYVRVRHFPSSLLDWVIRPATQRQDWPIHTAARRSRPVSAV